MRVEAMKRSLEIDKLAIFRHLALGPVTAVVYALYAFGYTIHHKLPEGWKRNAWAYTYGLMFAVINCLYNAAIGTVIFWEVPREWFFTDRLKRKKDEGHELAFILCRYLNIYDPGHC